MNATTANDTAALSRRRSNTTYRWIRQLHLWIGAWGALAAMVYGFSGLVLNHRFGDGAWPQGESEERARVTLQVPTEAQASAEALSLWLRDTQGLDAQVIRKGPPGGDKGGAKKEGAKKDAQRSRVKRVTSTMRARKITILSPCARARARVSIRHQCVDGSLLG